MDFSEKYVLVIGVKIKIYEFRQSIESKASRSNVLIGRRNYENESDSKH